MIEALTLPRLGETMEEGRVVSWLKKPGESFRRGETIVEIETDKTVVELPALTDGTLAEILVAEGTTVAVGTMLGRTEAQSTPQRTPAPGAQPAAPPPVPALPVADLASVPPSVASPSRIAATPLARREARQVGLDLSTLVGTGRRGRIEAADVRAAAQSTRPPASSADARVMDLPEGRLSFRLWEPSDRPAETTVMLLHGFAGDAQIWAALAAALVRAGARVIAPDLPAHGATTIEAATLGDLVAASGAFIDRLGLSRLHMVGHSLGAALACRLARQRPGLVRQLTLLAPAGLGGEIDGDFVAGMAAVTQGGALAHLLRRLALRPPPISPEQLDAMAAALGPRRRLAALATALAADGRQQIDITPDLQAIDPPIRILWGLEDRIIPWRHALAAPSRVALHVFRNAGHMIPWDQPEDIAALLAETAAERRGTP